MTTRLKAYLTLAAILAAAGAFAHLIARSEPGRTVELRTLDWRARRLARPERADKRIVLVAVDQESLDHFERESIYWPWPREMYSLLTAFLAKGGAKTVVFDVLFTNPTAKAEDEDFGLSLKKYGNAVLAMETSARTQKGRETPPPARFAVDASPRLSAAAAKSRSARFPIGELADGTALLGDSKVSVDQDGVVRSMPVAIEMGGRLYPSLAAAAAMAASGKSLDHLTPSLDDGRLLIRFHGRALTDDPKIKAYEAYRAGDLLLSWQALLDKRKPAVDPAVFKDKIVLVGLTAAGLLDNRPSPLSPVFAGTELIAAAADNFLNGDPLRRAGPGLRAALLLLALLCAGGAYRLARGGLGASAALVLGASLAVGAASFVAYSRGVWLELVEPQLALWLGFAAVTAYGYAIENKQKRFIQTAFSFYLSPEIVKRIADRAETLSLGGARREATFYFSDIQGFTSFSEKLDPETLTRLMNRYLGEMTDTILVAGGTLDKYIGDAIMAFWGAPLPRPDHALVACKAALDNQKRLAALRTKLEAEGMPVVRNRIGLNSGPASIGNMGSPKRFSYTAIGDAVNLASRLEGANKAYGTYILISESTREGAGAAIEVRELDFVRVMGKNVPIRVYELLGLAGETDPALVKKARRFEEGLALYRGSRFEEAEAVFESVVKEYGEDYASHKYVERCRTARREPPPAGWDGSHALSEK